MADWSLLLDTSRYETAGAALASSGGTLVTADGSAHTKGTYAEVISATAFDAVWLHVMAGGFGLEALIDLAVGGAGSEQIIATDLLVSEANSVQVTDYLLPLALPAGTRLSARCQTNVGGGSGRVLCQLGAGGLLAGSPYTRVTTYGAATADTGGTQLDPGATINTKGAYSEVVATTTAAASAVIVAFGGQGNLTRLTARYLVDVAVGGAGNEQIIIPDLLVRADNLSDMINPAALFLPCLVPAGARLAARAASSINDATDRLFDIIIYGVG